MEKKRRLCLPGPVEISKETYDALCSPMIGHRGSDFQDLFSSLQSKLKKLFGTNRTVLLSTSSAWGVMEASIRNLVGARGVVNCCCGAFSDKWFDVSKRCGKRAYDLRVDWGKAIRPEQVDDFLSNNEVDALTLVHSESSTGVLNPLREISEVMKKHSDVSFIVDCVSSFSVVDINFDDLGIDVLLTGSQKSLALPPGLALFALSERALERASLVADRGYYFDFLEFVSNAEKNMTPSTPSISLIFALKSKLEEIFTEGLTNRFKRYSDLNKMAHDWVIKNGFEFFAEEGYRAPALTCIRNNKGIDVSELQKRMYDEFGYIVDGGYGKVKGKTFRISNMGDENHESMVAMLNAYSTCLM